MRRDLAMQLFRLRSSCCWMFRASVCSVCDVRLCNRYDMMQYSIGPLTRNLREGRVLRKVFGNRKFMEFSGLKTRRECFRSQPYHDPNFQICFRTSCDKYVCIQLDQQYWSSGRKTCNMRHAKAPPIVFRFLLGLVLVVEFVAPEHIIQRSSIVHGVGTR